MAGITRTGGRDPEIPEGGSGLERQPRRALGRNGRLPDRADGLGPVPDRRPPLARQHAGHRARDLPRQASVKGRVRVRAVAAVVVVAAAVLAGCSTPLAWRPPSAASPLSSAISASAIDASGPAPGVYEQGVPGSWSPLTEFTAATGVHPRIVLYYSGWTESFRSAFGEQ